MRGIGAGEELTYAYGEPNPGLLRDALDDAAAQRERRAARPYRCGTAACLGYMPFDGV